MKKAFREPNQTEVEIQVLVSRALKFGYLSFLFGLFCGPVAIYYSYRAQRMIHDTGHGKRLRRRAKEGRNIAIFGTGLWLALIYIQLGETFGWSL